MSKENNTYDSLYLQMIRTMIRTQLGHEFKTKFKYTLVQEESLDGLIRFLRKDAKEATESTLIDALQAYHRFCWALVNNRDAKCHTKWENPIERFLWIRALCSDGSFLSAKDVTTILAQLKYFCRLVTLYEGLFNCDRNLLQNNIMSVLFHLVLMLRLTGLFFLADTSAIVTTLPFSWDN